MRTHWDGCEEVHPEYAEAREIYWEPEKEICDEKTLVDSAYDQFLRCNCGSKQFTIRMGPYVVLATCCLCHTEAEIFSG